MNLRLIDWIWHIRGSVPLAPGQSADDAFERLDRLFRERDTHLNRSHDTLTFTKSNQAPQDKMSIFDEGVLRIEPGEAGAVLRYDLSSRILLFCFLAPLLFLSFAGVNLGLGVIDQPTAAEKAEAKKKAEEKKKKDAERPQHPIDKFLGAPAPDKPEDEKEDKKDEDEEDEGPSPTPAYIFAGIFAALYAGGRLLEQWLIKSLFRKRLSGVPPAGGEPQLAK